MLENSTLAAAANTPFLPTTSISQLPKLNALHSSSIEDVECNPNPDNSLMSTAMVTEKSKQVPGSDSNLMSTAMVTEKSKQVPVSDNNLMSTAMVTEKFPDSNSREIGISLTKNSITEVQASDDKHGKSLLHQPEPTSMPESMSQTSAK